MPADPLSVALADLAVSRAVCNEYLDRALRAEVRFDTLSNGLVDLRLALRLPADAPFDAVLARARHLAELYDGDPERTRDDVIDNYRSTT